MKLTEQERVIAKMLADGHTTKSIGLELTLSPKTIEYHRAKLWTKLGLNSIALLTKYCVRNGLTTL